MEAYRMAGHSYIKGKEKSLAKVCLRNTLEFGRKLDLPTRRGSTLPYAGRELKKLSSFFEKTKVDEEMITLVGNDWESLANVKKAKKRAEQY